MTILFAGGEMGAFVPADSNTNESTTNTSGTYFTASFARAAIFVDNYQSYAESLEIAGQTDFWFHGEVYITNDNAAASYAIFLNSSGTEVFRLIQPAGDDRTVKFQYWDGAAWADFGSTFEFPIEGRQVVDIHIDVTNGDAELYLAGTERHTATGTLSGITNIAQVRLGSPNDAYWSQIIMADEPTIGMRIATYYPSGAGATSTWVGAYSGIDEAVYSDADFIYSDTADEVSTFAVTGPDLTGYVVRAVAVYARAKRGASGPANIQLALRVNGTDYFSASQALGLGYGAHGALWQTNPDTTVDWLTSGIAALQPGVKSIT